MACLDSSCINASECETKNLPHDQCVGEWNCNQGKCEWNCHSGMPNPASVKCVEDGGTIKILKDSAGGEYGLCIFSDNSYCDEWTYFRGECSKGENLMECSKIGSQSEGWYDSKNMKLIYWDNCAKCETTNNCSEFTSELKCLGEWNCISNHCEFECGGICNGHELGESWKDKCNTCTCTEQGIACTEMGCPENYCNSVEDCDGIAHILCIGEWECNNNTCSWNCGGN
ncbi:MAG: DUF333 domain-containing protein [Candidatus Diapherotrites archaeon]|nr:DUF333 domain-containing protein [Candidatus Diapherotrites archaeon]